MNISVIPPTSVIPPPPTAPPITMSTIQDEPIRSKYKGVYRCGKRWKAQFQNQGVQFYLGMFDTEEEAAEAYLTKARRFQPNAVAGNNSSSNLGKSTNGGSDDGINGQPMYQNLVHRSGDEPVGFVRDNNNYDSQNNIYPLSKRFRVSSSSSSSFHHSQHSSLSSSQPMPRQGDLMTSLQAKLMWERLMSIYQRVLLAKAVAEKLTHLQTSSAPNQQREALLKNLGEEMVMLGIVKQQLEEAVTRYFIREVSLQPSLSAQGSLDTAAVSSRTETIDHMTFDLPLDPIETAVFPLTHLTTPVQNLQQQPSTLMNPDALSGASDDNSSARNSLMLPTDTNQSSKSNLARTDTLWYDVPTVGDGDTSGTHLEPLLTNISVLTNVQSLQQCHSLQYAQSVFENQESTHSRPEKTFVAINSHTTTSDGSFHRNAFTSANTMTTNENYNSVEAKEMQDLQHLIELQQSSMKSTNTVE